MSQMKLTGNNLLIEEAALKSAKETLKMKQKHAKHV